MEIFVYIDVDNNINKNINKIEFNNLLINKEWSVDGDDDIGKNNECFNKFIKLKNNKYLLYFYKD